MNNLVAKYVSCNGDVEFDTSFELRLMECLLVFEFTSQKTLPLGLTIAHLCFVRDGVYHEASFYDTLQTRFEMILTKYGSYKVWIQFNEWGKKKAVMVTDVIFFNSKNISSGNCNTFLTQMENRKRLMSKISEYHFADYLYYRGIREAHIFANEYDADIAAEVLSILFIDTRLRIKSCISDKYQFEVSIKGSEKTKLRFISPVKLCKANVIVVDFNKTSIWKNYLHDCTIIDLDEMINKRLPAFFISERSIIEYARQNSRVSVLAGTLVPDIRSSVEKSHDEKKIAETKSFLDSILNNIKTGGWIPGGLSRFSYDQKTLLELLRAPNGVLNDGLMSLQDYTSENVNVTGGIRITTDQPSNYNRVVYTFGYSTVFGVGSPDSHTICSCLQRLLNEADVKTIVINCCNALAMHSSYILQYMWTISPNPGDIVICPGAVSADLTNIPSNIYRFNILPAIQRPHDYGEIFVDIRHLNQIGNEVLATELFSFMNEHNLFSQNNAEHVTPSLGHVNNQNSLSEELLSKLTEYKSFLQKMRPQIGAIVMNCNPFTLGHRYLIEQSAKKVEKLFVFVVEEDKSIFPFADRIELVRKGTTDLRNIKVLPSGKFIISSLTFSDYFNKSELQDRTIDPSQDVELFGKHIAPALGITVRFAGEEPLDCVTHQYNNAMKRILPQYGIDFEIIPRKEQNGEVISASRVRKLLGEKDFDEIAKLVPETTLAYLKDYISQWQNTSGRTKYDERFYDIQEGEEMSESNSNALQINHCKLYMENSERAVDTICRDYFIQEDPKVCVVKNGMILPFISPPPSEQGGKNFCGGVCDADSNFIAANMQSRNKNHVNTITFAYPPPTQMTHIKETVVYGGVLTYHYGHVLLENLTRLWWYLENRNCGYKFAFVPLHSKYYDKEVFFEIVSLLGLKQEDILIIEEPTCFDSVIVPEQSFYLDSFTSKALTVYNAIRDNIAPAGYEKIFLIRSRLDGDYSGIKGKYGGVNVNEKYFEEYFQSLGYEIIIPEQLSIKEKVSIFSGAREIVSANGTNAIQALLFCRENTSLTILNRVPGHIFTESAWISSAKNVQCTFIDVAMNLLPVYPANFPVLFMPTSCFKQYAQDQPGDWPEPENVDIREFALDYIERWVKTVSSAPSDLLQTIRKYTLADVVICLNQYLFDQKMDEVTIKRLRDAFPPPKS